MRKLIPTLVVIAAAALVGGLTGTALAGGPGCPNQCPLAKSANELRSSGHEAVRSSRVVRKDVREEVLAALSRV